MTTVDWTGVATAWEQRRDHAEEATQPVARSLLEGVRLSAGDRVLEVGAGTGDLARVLAEVVGPTGSVLATDPAAGMVEVARRTLTGLPQASASQAAGSDTGLADASVDVVLSRMALMFDPDPARALQEARRVLVPSGRFAAAVWAGPQHNPWMSTVGISAMLAGAVQGGPPIGPGEVFSLADSAHLLGLLDEAGFGRTSVQEVAVTFAFPTTEEQFDSVSSLAAPLALALSGASEAQVTAARRMAAEAAEPFRTGDGFVFPGLALVASGVRP
ncbi:MAG: class I SAM-dependent methyltransferase [Mycobacteriales bacterium]